MTQKRSRYFSLTSTRHYTTNLFQLVFGRQRVHRIPSYYQLCFDLKTHFKIDLCLELSFSILMSEDSLDYVKEVNVASLDLLLQEIVPTAIRISNKVRERRLTDDRESEFEETRMDSQLSSIEKDYAGSVHILESNWNGSDDVTLRVEGYGYSLGQRLSEILMYRSSVANQTAKFIDILDIMKFVCRDVWKCLYGKQMDNLRTNHRGTFVLVDTKYRLIARMNSSKGMYDTLAKAKTYLWFPCGIIRGILISFGIDAAVTAEIVSFPSVTFNIQTSINN